MADSDVKPTMAVTETDADTVKTDSSLPADKAGTTITESEVDVEKANATSMKAPDQEWPVEPHGLKPDKWSELLANVLDAVVVLVPLGLIVKCGLVIAANQYNVNNFANGWNIDTVGSLTLFLVRFNHQLTTVFTIIFVTILSTMLRRYALWKAQKGAYVATLEQFQASISLPSTIKTIISLQAFTLTSLGLIAVWSFYYLGSQASSNEFHYRASKHAHNGYGIIDTVGYGNSLLLDPTFNEDAKANAWQMFTQLENSQAAVNGYDQYGGPIIPVLESMQTSAVHKGWTQVGPLSQFSVIGAEAGNWVSVLGIGLDYTTYYADYVNTFGYYVGYSGEYTVDSYTYLLLNCSAPASADTSVPGYPANLTLGSFVALSPDAFANNATTVDAPYNINYWTVVNNGTVVQSCRFSRSYVTVMATCDGKVCVPKQLQQSSANASDQAPTPYTNRTVIETFLDMLNTPGATTEAPTSWQAAIDKNCAPDAFANYQDWFSLNSSQQADLQSTWAESAVSMTALTTCFNTLHLLTIDSPNVNFNATFPLSAFQQNVTDNPFFQISSFKGAAYFPEYVLSYPWLVIDLVSNLILLVAAGLSFYFRRITIAPDIFGYVSSLTRDNPDLDLPTAGSTLSGLERAKLMKSVKIKISGVESGEVKKVGIVSAKKPDGHSHLSPEEYYA